MRYLITTNNTYAPFFTKWFEPEDYFNEDLEMVVFDLEQNKFTNDGETWHDIEVDHL